MNEIPLRPVGTGDGGVEGWGPCACPRRHPIHMRLVRQMGYTRTRTGTRPPPLHPSTPCPYRMGDGGVGGLSILACNVYGDGGRRKRPHPSSHPPPPLRI